LSVTDGEEDQDGCTQTTTSTPDFKPDGLSVEWTSLPATLLYRIFDLSARTADADAAIGAAAEHAGPPDYEQIFVERQMQFSELGLVAAQLAAELRTLAKLPGRTENEHWDPVSEIKRKRDKLIEREKLRREKHAQWLAASTDPLA
jgi:hypothetical protein